MRCDARVRASVPAPVRLDTTANHTATHLLHKALKDILGATVQQAGSLVAPDRLRFDYTYHQPLTDAQIKAIEDAVNERVRANLEVTKTVMPLDEAKQSGAVAMFGEKYGDQVRIVAAGDYSREFCGGCHVNRTGDIGIFKIVSDRSLAAGVRRMEAVTGRGALRSSRSSTTPRTCSPRRRTSRSTSCRSTSARCRRSRRARERAEAAESAHGHRLGIGGAQPADESIDVSGVKLIARRVDELTGGDLRNFADELRSKLKSGVVVLGSATDGKVTLLTAVTKDLLDRVQANTLIGKLAPIVGGKGGGKPDLAQAGGKDADKLNEAIATAPAALREILG